MNESTVLKFQQPGKASISQAATIARWRVEELCQEIGR